MNIKQLIDIGKYKAYNKGSKHQTHKALQSCLCH